MLVGLSEAVTYWALAAGAPAPGGYCNPVKILAMLVLIVPWLLVAPWVQKDAHRVRTWQALWTVSVLAVGAVSVLLWLLIPLYVLGLLIYVVLTGAAVMAYLVHRDGRVAEEHKLLTARIFTKLLESRRKKVAPLSRVKLYTSDGKVTMPPEPEAAEASEILTYNKVQELLHDLLWRRASEVDLRPAGDQTRVRYVIDGVANNRPALSLSESEGVVQYLKRVAGADPEDHRRPQEGKFTVDVAGQPIDIIVTTAGTTGGQRMQFRVIQESIRTHLGELGMSRDVLGRVQGLNTTQPGLIIASGRPGSGVTSTLYSLLREHDAFIRHLITLEASIEVELENVTQYEYKQDAKLPQALASALRRDPDVVMVDRCPDKRTAEILREAAAQKAVLLGMYASDTFTALAKWVKVTADAAAAVAPLRAVLCQILVRSLCPKCREAYRPDPQLLAKANLPTQKIETFYRPPTSPLTDEKGRPFTCPTCQGSGYLGRTAVFELLELTDEIRQAVASGASLTQIKKACRRNKMLYLQEQALRKVIEGQTSVQEVLRVSQSQQKP